MPLLNSLRFARRLLFACAVLFACVQGAHAIVHNRTATTIPMSDGRSLAADIYLPPGEGPWPTVLIQTPYNKATFLAVFRTESSRNPLLKSPDYGFVVLDWRGFFASADAAYQGAPSRGRDGAEAVEWVAAQTWCTGAVGTWGASALGTVQLQTARERPPHLRACVPMVCHFGESYDLWFPGGVYYKNRNDFVASYYGLGNLFRDQPLRGPFWSITEGAIPGFDGVTTPMLFVSGWYDHEPAATIREFEKMRAAQGPESPTRLLVGPWGHSAIDGAVQGELSYPAAEFASALEALRFFDLHLRSIPPASPPPVISLFQMNEDRWESFREWPPSNFPRRLFFDAGGLLGESAPPAEIIAAWASDPTNPVPSLFGALLTEESGGTQGPGDLTALVGREDVVVFGTPPLEAPLRLGGTPEATLWISSDAPDVDLAVRLLQVTPDGRHLLLCDGIRRASLRASYAAKELLQPGVPVRIPVEFAPIAVTIPVGHRLGVLVAGSNFDLFEVNPQDGSNYGTDVGASPRPAMISLHGSEGMRSFVELPVLPGESGWMTY